jgi:Ice-binding-like/Bacterial Ig-like domain
MARVAIGAAALVLAGQLAAVSAAAAAPPAAEGGPTFVDLGAAAPFSLLGGTGVANTGAGTVLAGDLGLSPGGVIAGFPPGTVSGAIHDKDAAADAAQSATADAYADAAGQTSTTTFSGDQAGKTFHPGVHTDIAAFTNTGTITLDADGDSSSVFVFQVGAAFSSAAGSKVVLAGGALANNVFWQVTGAVSLGAGAKLVGTFLGAGAITFGDGASIKGRALTSGTVAVTNSPFTEPIDDLTAPIVTIDGGATRSTSDATPPISGTSDEPAGRAVTIIVGGQTLHATMDAGGLWRVSANALVAGPHTVVASITDPSQNVGSATQVLTVDVTAPGVSIDGGATAATNDTTPSISGTTDAPADTTVTVTVGAQTLTTTAGAAGAWSVDAAVLSEAPHLVVVSVDDAAHNTGTALQVLSVDVTVPVVAIDGGSADSTADTSPWIYGTTAEQAGTRVDVAVGSQVLTATVLTGGTWGVSATTLPTGVHQVVASITDLAHNTGTTTQALTITGGAGPPPGYRPDAAIRAHGGAFVGVGVFHGARQQATIRLEPKARSATFEVRVTNRGDSMDRAQLTGTPSNRRLTVTYRAGGQDVTRAVTAGSYRTVALAAGDSARLTVTVSRTSRTARGDRRTFVVRAASSHAPATRDAVAAVVRVGG